MISNSALLALAICILGIQGCGKEPATQQKEEQIDKSKVMGESDKINPELGKRGVGGL